MGSTANDLSSSSFPDRTIGRNRPTDRKQRTDTEREERRENRRHERLSIDEPINTRGNSERREKHRGKNKHSTDLLPPDRKTTGRGLTRREQRQRERLDGGKRGRVPGGWWRGDREEEGGRRKHNRRKHRRQRIEVDRGPVRQRTEVERGYTRQRGMGKRRREQKK